MDEDKKTESFVIQDDSVEPESQWKYQMPEASHEEVRWTASEFIAHDRSPLWYLAVLAGGAALSVLIYFLTKDLLSPVILAMATIIFLVAASRKPRVLEYVVDGNGLEIAGKFYPYSDFRSFGIVHDGAFSNITLMPLKRFMPPISIYYAPEDSEKIVDTLAAFLPMEEYKLDLIDSLIRKLRF